MQPYTKTNWVNDETNLSATNMNKIENQLEALTTNAINEAEDMGDLEDLDTTDKTSLVNAINEVASSGGGAIYEITYTDKTKPSQTLNTTANKTAVNNFLNDLIYKGKNSNIITYLGTSYQSRPDGYLFLFCAIEIISNNNLKLVFNRYMSSGSNTPNSMEKFVINVGYSISNNLYNVYSLQFNEVSNYKPKSYFIKPINAYDNGDGRALTTTNNSYYTPSSDHNPATKKYVDDSITSAVGNINTVLATLTTPSNNGGA